MVVMLAGGSAKADQKDPVLDALFAALTATKNAEEAQAIERRIWQTWAVTGQELVDNAMARGVIALNKGAFETALKYCCKLVISS